MKRLLLAFITLAAPTALTAPAFAGLKDAMNKALSARRRAVSGSRRKTNAGLRKSRFPGLRVAYAIPPARAPTKVDAPVVHARNRAHSTLTSDQVTSTAVQRLSCQGWRVPGHAVESIL